MVDYFLLVLSEAFNLKVFIFWLLYSIVGLFIYMAVINKLLLDLDEKIGRWAEKEVDKINEMDEYSESSFNYHLLFVLKFYAIQFAVYLGWTIIAFGLGIASAAMFILNFFVVEDKYVDE